MTSLFLLAGEASGDLLGSSLVRALHRKAPGLNLWGVGGPKMRNETFASYLRMEDFQLMGFRQIACGLPTVIKQFRQLRKEILRRNPQGVVLIDYPGLNLCLAKSLRRHGYEGKIIQYVSPTVWVWGKGRIQTLAKNYDLLLTVLPFEPQLYRHTNLEARYVGSPVFESVQGYKKNPAPLKSPSSKKILALFPGSRRMEIENNFALQLRAAEKLVRQSPEFAIYVSCSQPQYRFLIEKIILDEQVDAVITEGRDAYPLMEACHVALAKSGTVTLELALFHKPAAVIYRVDWFNRFVAKHILRLNMTHVALANIIAGKTVQPEFVLETYTEDDLSRAVQKLAFDPKARKTCLEGYQEVEKELGTKKASEEASQAILRLLGFSQSAVD